MVPLALRPGDRRGRLPLICRRYSQRLWASTGRWDWDDRCSKSKVSERPGPTLSATFAESGSRLTAGL